MPSGAATMQTMRMRVAPASRSRLSAATALPPVASIGSIISTKLRTQARQAAWSSNARRPRSIRRAAARCVRRAHPGTSSSTASSMPRPARSTGTTTMSDSILCPSAGPSGVSTVVGAVPTSRKASAASSTLIRVAARRKCSGAVRLSRRSMSASCTSGWSTMWTGTAPHYTISRPNARTPRSRLPRSRSLSIAGLAAQPGRRAGLSRRRRRHGHHRKRDAPGSVARGRGDRRHRDSRCRTPRIDRLPVQRRRRRSMRAIRWCCPG